MICLVIPVFVVTMIVFGKMYYATRRIETGQFGAFGLGVFGMLWTQVLIPMLIVFIMTMMGLKISSPVVNLAYNAILEGILVSVGILWGIYLTNNRGQKSMSRSIIVGLGFGFAAAVVYQYKYILAIFYAIKINMGMTMTSAQQGLLQTVGLSDAGITTLLCLARLAIYVLFAYLIGLKVLKKEKLGKVTLLVFVASLLIRLIEELLLKLSWGQYALSAIMVVAALFILRYLLAQQPMKMKESTVKK